MAMTTVWHSYHRLDPRFRLDNVFTSEIDPETGKEKHGFETVEDSVKEDRLRVQRMELGQPKRLNWTNNPIRRFNFQQRQRLCNLTTPEIPVAQVNALMARLAAGAHSGEHCSSLASSLSMRNLRLSWIGAVLECFECYSDDEIVTFTVLNANWVFTADDLQQTSAAAIKNQFRTHLDRIHVDEIPGPLIAFLHGEFEPTSGKYVLHFHGVTTRKKYARVLAMSGPSAITGIPRRWGYVKTSTRAVPIRSEPVSDRPRQFSYLSKSFWPQRQVVSLTVSPSATGVASVFTNPMPRLRCYGSTGNDRLTSQFCKVAASRRMAD